MTDLALFKKQNRLPLVLSGLFLAMTLGLALNKWLVWVNMTDLPLLPCLVVSLSLAVLHFIREDKMHLLFHCLLLLFLSQELQSIENRNQKAWPLEPEILQREEPSEPNLALPKTVSQLGCWVQQ